MRLPIRVVFVTPRDFPLNKYFGCRIIRRNAISKHANRHADDPLFAKECIMLMDNIVPRSENLFVFACFIYRAVAIEKCRKTIGLRGCVRKNVLFLLIRLNYKRAIRQRSQPISRSTCPVIIYNSHAIPVLRSFLLSKNMKGKNVAWRFVIIWYGSLMAVVYIHTIYRLL